jgi:biopolymer transport protein ExbB
MKSRRSFFIASAIAALVAGSAMLSAQDAKPAAPAAKEEGAAAPHKKSLGDLFVEGGVIMWPLVACSIGMMYLIIDGSIRTSQKRAIPPDEVAAVKGAFREGDYVGAYNFLKGKQSPFAKVCRAGVSMLGEGKTAVEETVMQELAKENSHTNHFISYLSVLGVCTPMIGLLGTVSGMISAFDSLGTAGIGDPSKLAGAIGEVLVATFSGLAIAIPAFGAYYFLRNRATKIVHDIQDTMNSLFRKMPYDQLRDAHIGGEELYAGTPNWVTTHPHAAAAADINA